MRRLATRTYHRREGGSRRNKESSNNGGELHGVSDVNLKVGCVVKRAGAPLDQRKHTQLIPARTGHYRLLQTQPG